MGAPNIGKHVPYAPESGTHSYFIQTAWSSHMVHYLACLLSTTDACYTKLMQHEVDHSHCTGGLQL